MNINRKHEGRARRAPSLEDDLAREAKIAAARKEARTPPSIAEVTALATTWGAKLKTKGGRT